MLLPQGGVDFELPNNMCLDLLLCLYGFFHNLSQISLSLFHNLTENTIPPNVISAFVQNITFIWNFWIKYVHFRFFSNILIEETIFVIQMNPSLMFLFIFLRRSFNRTFMILILFNISSNERMWEILASTEFIGTPRQPFTYINIHAWRLNRFLFRFFISSVLRNSNLQA